MDYNIELTYTKPQQEIFFNIEDGIKYIIITKGRRFGLTKGGANFFIECMLNGEPLLWGDTIHSNIDKYVERYFKPELNKIGIPYNWNSQKKTLEIPLTGGYCDFRSADNPENWEGFGYKKIFLNEAGIILKNEYLYTNAVLPMMMDYPDSILFAGGVPKGKKNKKGGKHRFYELAEYAKKGHVGYKYYNFSSYDSMLDEKTISELENEIRRMNPEMVRQEIYGEFVDGASGLLWELGDIENARCTNAPSSFKRVIVSIDPAITSNSKSDETGIITLGLGYDENIYILSDESGIYTPEGWSLKSCKAMDNYGGSSYVAEKNQGGEMVKTTLRLYDKKRKIKLIPATSSKFSRAEPVYALYEQGRVKHVGEFDRLEDEMINFNPKLFSPNRVDALVHGVSELLNKTTTKFKPSFI